MITVAITEYTLQSSTAAVCLPDSNEVQLCRCLGIPGPWPVCDIDAVTVPGLMQKAGAVASQSWI